MLKYRDAIRLRGVRSANRAINIALVWWRARDHHQSKGRDYLDKLTAEAEFIRLPQLA